MPLVVDAYNVLHVTGVLPPELAGLDLDGLADLLEGGRYARDEAWVVCDGVRPTPPPRRRERVWYSFAGASGTADEVITGLVDRSSAPRRMTVVTSDRAVLKRVKARGAETVQSEAFLERLAADWERARPERRFGLLGTGLHAGRGAKAKRPTPPLRATVPLAAPAVRVWLRLFGLDPASAHGGQSGGQTEGQSGSQSGGDLASIAPSEAPKAERPTPVPKVTPPMPPPAQTNGSTSESDDPLAFVAAHLEELLAGTPPRRAEPRAPRRSRKDRRP
jgi:predicted RNA-binding protein with PIN domain